MKPFRIFAATFFLILLLTNGYSQRPANLRLDRSNQFILSMGKQVLNTSLATVVGKPVVVPLRVDLVFELEPIGKKEKKNKNDEQKLTNTFSIEFLQNDTIRIGGAGALDYLYTFPTSVPEPGGKMRLNWQPTSELARNTVSAPVKASSVIMQYNGKTVGKIEGKLAGSFSMVYMDAANQQVFKWNITYNGPGKEMVVQLDKGAKTVVLNSTLIERAKGNPRNGHWLKVYPRNL